MNKIPTSAFPASQIIEISEKTAGYHQKLINYEELFPFIIK